jgi:hypothetical protein
MPRPENIEKVFDELLYEPKVLKQANWNIHKTKDAIIVRTYVKHEKYGQIAYILRAESVEKVWLRVSQYDHKRSIKDKEIINIPLSWLPEGYREDFELFLTQLLFSAPIELQT